MTQAQVLRLCHGIRALQVKRRIMWWQLLMRCVRRMLVVDIGAQELINGEIVFPVKTVSETGIAAGQQN